MWSHTIKSSSPKSTNPPAERPARAGNNLKKENSAVKEPGEDMTKGFDADGFSKTSKVHAYKKPLTVPKAPSFSRTTSRVGQTATSETDPLRKDSQDKSTQPVRSTHTPRTGAPARVSRTATPTQSSSKASKAGTPSKTKPPVTSPKNSVSGRRLTNTSAPNDVRFPGSESPGTDLGTQKADKPEESLTNDDNTKDENEFHDISKAKDLGDNQGLEELKQTIAVKDGEIRDLQMDIQKLQTTKDAEIQELQAQIGHIQVTSEHENKESKAALSAQIAPLESELEDARNRIRDLEASCHKVQEESDRSLGLKDEEIQRLSQAAHERRRELETKESALSLKGEFQRLQTQHKRELDEAVAAASAEVEAVQVERDELIQSRDKEIKEMSELVQELQEKVEQAHQADKDELKEANRRHDQKLQEKVEEHEQELRDKTAKHQKALRDDASQYELKLRDAITRYGELQERVSQLEEELRNAAAKYVQEKSDAEEEHQAILRDAAGRHQQESRDTASKYQKEVEDLMLMHHEELKTARTRNDQASEDSTTKHQQEIEALTAKHKEELEIAATRQAQAIEDAAADYQQKFQSLERKHLEEIRSAATRDEGESKLLSTKHQEELQNMTARHQVKLEEVMATHKQDSSNAAIQSQQAIEAMRARHQEESRTAASQIDELRVVTKRQQQELADGATIQEQELERVASKYRHELHEVTEKHGQELEEARAKYQELEGESTKKEQFLQELAQKYEEDAGRLQKQPVIAADKAVTLEMKPRELDEESGREAIIKYERILRATIRRNEEELQSLRTIYATAVEEITALREKLQDVEQKQREAVEEELQSLRTIYATAVEEISALRRKVEAVDQKRCEAVDEAASLKASLDDHELKRSEAVDQLSSLKDLMKDGEPERSEAAVETALLKDKLELADRRFEQDQQSVSDLQRQVRGLQEQIEELSKEKDLDQTEAAVDAALFKDKLELADLEIHLHKGTISALQNEVEKLKSQLAENSADTSLDHNEAVVDVALLKDKLEVADIQIRQAKGTVSNLQEEIEGLKSQITDSAVGMDLDQNEAAVEIALLKNTLELANLESHQDKATIATLRKQIDGLQVQVNDTPKTGGAYTHHQLRDELSMLERHHDAQMIDLDSLKANVAAESKVREEEWKKRADVWDQLASELQGMKTQLVGTVGGNSIRAGSSE